MGVLAGLRSIGFFAAITLSGSLAALTYSNTMSAYSTSAQNAPVALSPLRVEPDPNGVNIVSGKTQMPIPTLAVPGSTRLKFDRVQYAAPYMKRTRYGDVDSQSDVAIQTAEATSESFHCIDTDCESSGIGTGSTYRAGIRQYRQAGTGVLYTFSAKSFDELVGTNFYSLYYVSTIKYPDGETLTYSYDSAVVPGDFRTYRRPVIISSNTGYYIKISYSSATFDPEAPGSTSPIRAALYGANDPVNSLAELNDSGGSVTDKAGRVFAGVDMGIMDNPVEISSGSMKLPGEAALAIELGSATFPTAPYSPVVTSYVKDGVTWTYTYINPREALSCNGIPITGNIIFDRVIVTGPNGYNTSYDINQGGSCPPLATGPSIGKITDSLGRSTQYQYDANGRPTRVIYPEGNQINVTYDAFANINSKVTKAKPGSGVADIRETAFVDTATCQGVLCYRPVWMRDGLGRQTDYVYNASGQVTERTDPADANGVRRKTYTTYDATSGISRPTVVRVCGTGAACGSTSEIRTEYSYWGNTLLPLQERRIDAASSLVAVTDYSYDAAGRALSVDGPLPGADDTVYFRYDIVGRKTWEIAAKGPNGKRKATRFTYRNADDKVIATEVGTVPDPTSTAFTPIERIDTSYDSRRNPAKIVRSASGTIYAVTDQFFTDRGQLECGAVRMNPAAFAVTPGACTLGVSGAHGPDRIARNFYDAAGQLLKKQVAMGTVDQADEVTYAYTPNGKALSVTDGMGNLTTYEFDGFDRLAKTRFPGAANGAVSSTTDYEAQSYDAVGNVTQRRLRDGQVINYTYDNLNQVTFKDVPNGVYAEQDINYRYDLLGRVIRASDVTTHFTAFVYDGLGRLTSEQSNWTTRTMRYDLAGRLTRLTWGDGFYVLYNRHTTGEVINIMENGQSTGPGVLGTYFYDDLGRMTWLYRGNGAATNYIYDPVGRLSELNHDLGGTTHDVGTRFTQNPANQIASLLRSNDVYAWNGHGNVDRDYSVNGLNQLTTAGSTALSYDSRGNLTNLGSKTYVYTSENRLTNANGWVIAYDPMGRYFFMSNGTPLYWVQYDGNNNLIEERDNGGVQRRYVYGPGTDTPLVWYEGSGTTDKRWLIPDERGSIIAVTNASGAVTNVNRYDEYGVPAATNVGRFQYTGQAWIPELQLYSYKARIYAPSLGRFMQTDPTGYDDGPNWYDYVGGDPVNKSDPTGLESGDVSYRSALSLAEGARSNPPPPEAVTAAMYAPLSGPIIRAFVAVFGPSGPTTPIVPRGPSFKPSDQPGAGRPGTRGHPDHQADVRGPGRAQAEAHARPGERVATESPVVGHPGVRRNADNQVIGIDGRTRLVVESERRPNGTYHKERVKELEACGIECQTRVLRQRQ
jgi:RHS repeat-associated protein